MSGGSAVGSATGAGEITPGLDEILSGMNDQDMVKVLPLRGELDEKRAVVYTEMRLDDGTVVPVNYSMRKSSAGWRVYDVRIEGISYIQNYRNQFNAEIRANGVDAVIEPMRAENAALETAGREETPVE